MDNLNAVVKASREHCAQHQKSGNDQFYNAIQAATAQQLRGQALSNAATLGLVGFGVGAGGRGLKGLLQLIHKNMNPPKRTTPTGLPIDIPLEEEEKVGGAIADFFRGDKAQTVAGVPWAIPAAVGAGAAGLAGGWGLMDHMLDARRKGDLDMELEKAKQEYETALLQHSGKVAGDNELGRELDELYDLMQKKSDYWTDLLGQGTGLYGLFAGASGLGAASLAYEWGKKRQRRALINAALKERRKRRFSHQPPPAYARPRLSSPEESLPSFNPPAEHTAFKGLDI